MIGLVGARDRRIWIAYEVFSLLGDSHRRYSEVSKLSPSRVNYTV